MCAVSDSEATINTIVVEGSSKVFVSGSADARVTVRRINVVEDGCVNVTFLQRISLTPPFFPLAQALSPLPGESASSLILAVAGTKNIIQVFVAQSGNHTEFELQAKLTGHEGWIRSLDFISETKNANADLLLASASQDKYIRLWRVHQGKDLPPAIVTRTDPALGVVGKSLSNKAHQLRADDLDYSVTFEALLLGHDDWVYTASWLQTGHVPQLLSASADGSLAIWEAERSSGVWICQTRLGEIGSQKGATTATGSAGGYWIGLWSRRGKSLVCLGRTGGWRLWNWNEDGGRWLQTPAVGGHVKEVTGVAWARDGSYLLSTGYVCSMAQNRTWSVLC